MQIGDDVTRSALRSFTADATSARGEYQAMNQTGFCMTHEIDVQKDSVTNELFLVGERSATFVPAGTTFTTTFKNSSFSTSPQGGSIAGFGEVECASGRVCGDLSIQMVTSSGAAFTAVTFSCDAQHKAIVTGFTAL